MKPHDTKPGSKVQGEGDYDAARRYRQDVERFVQHNDTEKLAREAKPETRADAEDLEKAEAKGRARKRGEAPSRGEPSPAAGEKPRPR